MTSALLDVDGAALAVTDFLPTADLFSLHAVNRDWHKFLDEHEEKIFHEYLYRDFAEGALLRHAIADKYDIPKKKLYMAFTKRWGMPLPCDREDRMCIPWIRPATKKATKKRDNKTTDGGDSKETIEDGGGDTQGCAAVENGTKSAEVGSNSSVAAGKGDSSPKMGGDDKRKKSSGDFGVEGDSGLVFIGRVGDDECPLSCVPLKMKDSGLSQKLVFDREALYRIPEIATHCEADQYFLVSLQQDARTCELLKNVKGYEDEGHKEWTGDLHDAMRGKYDVTLHVIDVRTCQVLSLPLEIGGRDAYSFASKKGFLEPPYGWLELYGVPPRYSPRHRVFTDDDFRKLGDAPWEHDDYPPIDDMTVYCELKMEFDPAEDGDTMEISASMEDLTFDLGGEFSNIRRPESVCGFLRAMMQEKCVKGELGSSTLAALPVAREQPSWVESDVILDAVTQYASFEDQAGKLRLVCHQFQSSALRQLKQKMSKVKVIGFARDCEFGDCWFKATVRQGWSEDCLADKASVVDDALWLASCRCMFSHCKNKGSCPTASEPPKFSGYQVESASLNVKWARKELEEKGSFSLTKTDPRDFDSPHCYEPSNVVKCSFTQRKLGIFQLCDEVEKIIRKSTGSGYEEYEDELVALNGYLKKDYKVSKVITSRQFIRSLFLVFAKAKAAETNGSNEGGAAKKARLASIDEVSIGFAETNISGPESSYYARMKKIYRFYSAANEPMEISLESRSSSQF